MLLASLTFWDYTHFWQTAVNVLATYSYIAILCGRMSGCFQKQKKKAEKFSRLLVDQIIS